MKFGDFIAKDAVQPTLQAETKEEVIRELVGMIVASGGVAEEETEGIIKAIMAREELGSTGIGRGVAVPHTKHPSVDRLVGAIGISEAGVDFNSLDGETVNLFFLLISPPEKPSEHLRALENIARQLRHEMFCKFLKQSKTRDDIQQLLDEADSNQFIA